MISLKIQSLAIANLTENTETKLVAWGSVGNEFLRLVPLLFSADPDAVNYISLVEAAKGSPVTTQQLQAINDFIKAEKEASRWALHKRIYLPIWANSTANAIDMVTGTSGTWEQNQNMIHGSGFVKATVIAGPTSGRFNTGISMTTMGMTTSANYFAALLCKTASATSFSFGFGCISAGSQEFAIQFNGANTIAIAAGVNINAGALTRSGILAIGRDAGTAYLKRRSTSGVSTYTAASAGSLLPATVPIRVTGFSQDSGYGEYSIDSEMGLYAFGLGMSQANADAYTLNLKTLWETCTGLTLP